MLHSIIAALAAPFRRHAGLNLTKVHLMQAAGRGDCPVCDSPEALMEGPSGGMSMNAMCCRCGTRLNLGFGLGTGILYVHWTHGPQGEIWGPYEQSVFPTDERVEERRRILES